MGASVSLPNREALDRWLQLTSVGLVAQTPGEPVVVVGLSQEGARNRLCARPWAFATSCRLCWLPGTRKAGSLSR